MEHISDDELEETIFEILTRRIAPIGTPAGPRMRDPRRIKIGEATVSRIVIFEMLTSSMTAPSTLKIAKPKHPSKTQFAIVIFLKPPFDSVPNLIRPFRSISALGGKRLKVPSRSEPSSKLPLTMQSLMVIISAARAKPSAKELFRHIASSHGALTLQCDTRTLRQLSMSMPARLVSIFRLSMVR